FSQCPGVQCLSIVCNLFADAQRARQMRAEVRLESCAPSGQGQPAKVVAAVAQEIECDDRDRLRLVDLFDLTRAGEMDASLQTLDYRSTSRLRAQGSRLRVLSLWALASWHRFASSEPCGLAPEP